MPGLRKWIKHRLYRLTFKRYWDLDIYEDTAFGIDKVDSITCREGADRTSWEGMDLLPAAWVKYGRPGGANGVIEVWHDPVNHNVQVIPWGLKTAQASYYKDMQKYREMPIVDDTGKVIGHGVPYNMKVNHNLAGVDHTAGWFGGAALRKFMRILLVVSLALLICAGGLIYISNTRQVVCYETYHGQIAPCLPAIPLNSTSSSSVTSSGFSVSTTTTSSTSVRTITIGGNSTSTGGG